MCSNHSASRTPGLSPRQSRLRSTTTPSPSSQSEATEFLLLRESPPLFRPSLARSPRGSSRLSLNRSNRDLNPFNPSNPDPRLSQSDLSQSRLDLNQFNPDLRLSNLDLRLSNQDLRLSNQDRRLSQLDPSQSRLDLNKSKLDLRLLQAGLSLLLSSSLDSSQSPSQLEDRGQLPSQPSLAEHPEPGLSRDLSWEFPLSSRASSLSLLSLTAGSSPDLREVSLSSDQLRFSLLSSDLPRSNLVS